jgi:hypothetical protein
MGSSAKGDNRPLDSIGSAAHRLRCSATAPPRSKSASSLERIRTAVHEIAGSGLTPSKLSVPTSLLGDLVRN